MTPPEPALAVRVTRDVPVAAEQVSRPKAQMLRGLARIPRESAFDVAEGTGAFGAGWGAAGTAFVLTNVCVTGARPAACPGVENDSKVRATSIPTPTKSPKRAVRAERGESLISKLILTEID
jgi:hypothetical protein